MCLTIVNRLLDGLLFPPSPGIYNLCDPLPLSVSGTCDLLLTHRIWQKQWAFTSVIILYKIITSVFQSDSLSSSLSSACLMKQTVVFWDTLPWGPYGKELKVASGCWPTKNLRPQSNSFDWAEFYYDMSLEVTPFPVLFSDETLALAHTLIAGLLETETETLGKPCLYSWPRGKVRQ